MLLGASITVSGCDKISEMREPAKKPAASATAKKKPADKSINQPVEDAMMKIPPTMREAYQKAFTCEVERNKAKEGSKAINVTAEYVNGLVSRLKADPSLAEC